jgi:hypothetical protein
MLFAHEDGAAAVKTQKWNVTHSVMLVQLIILVGFALWATSGSGYKFVQGIASDAVYTSSK